MLQLNNMSLTDLITGRDGKISRPAIAFLAWLIFIITLIGFSTYKNGGKLVDLPQSYVYLTVVFCGTYAAKNYLDNKILGVPLTTTPTTSGIAGIASALTSPVSGSSPLTVTIQGNIPILGAVPLQQLLTPFITTPVSGSAS